jgi:hypothetical protein
MPYVDKMFDLFNDSYTSLSSFVAISDTQKNISKKNISFINPEYIKFVEDKDQLSCIRYCYASFQSITKKPMENFSF